MIPVTAEPLAPGVTLKQRYEIVRLIKGGGMSWVYQVRERRADATTRLWAMKELRMDPDDRHTLAEARQMFEQEAHILVQLGHRNLPRVAAYFTEGDRSYLVMEYVHGETLQERLSQTRAPLLESQVLPWAIQVCDVLDYLHTRQPPVIFRDVKPGNIMVTPSSVVKLIDFGIARTFKTGKQRDTITMGSENYAAPEQWGQGQTDPRSDLYSLGATLYHLLTNEPPLPAYVPGERAAIAERNPSVSERLIQIVERAMAPERGDRFHSAAEMRSALLRCLPPWERLRWQARPQESMPAEQPAPAPPSPKRQTRDRDTMPALPESRVASAPTLPRAAEATASASQPCRTCGIPNRRGARYCRLCGSRLQASPVATLAVAGEMPPRTSFRLTHRPMIVGRTSRSNQVDLDLNPLDPDAYVSRRHARITYLQDRYWITDLGSSNGTYLNDQRLEANQAVPLRHGDRIRMGQVELTFTQR